MFWLRTHLFALWIAALFLAPIARPALASFDRAKYVHCNRAYLEKLLTQFDTSTPLKLMAGREVSYPQESRFFSDAQRLDDVYVELDPGWIAPERLDLARTLAQGRAPEPVLAKINEALAEGKRLLSLKELMPRVLAERTGHQAEGENTPDCRGPNCFNAAMNWHDPSIGIGFTGAHEITQFLDRRARKLEAGEKLRFGDLIVISNKDPSDLYKVEHTAIYLDHDLVWHKASRFPADPWTFEKLESTTAYYFEETLAYLPEPDVKVEFYRFLPGRI